MMRPLFLTLSIFAFSAFWPEPVSGAQVSGDLKVYVLNIGQGDAILIVCPHGTHRMLIDTAAQGKKGSQRAFQAQMRALIPGPDLTINTLVVTHPHKDHVAGLEWVLKNFQVKKLIDSGGELTTTFANARTVAKAQESAGTLDYFNASTFPPRAVAKFCTGTNLKAELLLPPGYGNDHNENNNSVAVLVTYGSQKLLFTGDAEREEEKLLLGNPAIAKKLAGVSFYKVGHHGAETSTTADFLNVIKPKIAGASAGCRAVAPNGGKKGYRHPRAVILEALEQSIKGQGEERTLESGDVPTGKWTTSTIHTGVYVTSIDNTFVIVTDGTTIRKQSVTVAGAMGACPDQ